MRLFLSYIFSLFHTHNTYISSSPLILFLFLFFCLKNIPSLVFFNPLFYSLSFSPLSLFFAAFLYFILNNSSLFPSFSSPIIFFCTIFSLFFARSSIFCLLRYILDLLLSSLYFSFFFSINVPFSPSLTLLFSLLSLSTSPPSILFIDMF